MIVYKNNPLTTNCVVSGFILKIALPFVENNSSYA